MSEQTETRFAWITPPPKMKINIEKISKSMEKSNRVMQFWLVRWSGDDKPDKGMFSRVPDYIKAKGR